MVEIPSTKKVLIVIEIFKFLENIFYVLDAAEI